MFPKPKSLNTLMNFDWVHRRNRLRVLDPPFFGLLEAELGACDACAADACAADDRFLDAAEAGAAEACAADACAAEEARNNSCLRSN